MTDAKGRAGGGGPDAAPYAGPGASPDVSVDSVVEAALRGVPDDVAGPLRGFLAGIVDRGRLAAPPLALPEDGRDAGLAWADRERHYVDSGKGGRSGGAAGDRLVHREPRAWLERALDRWLRDTQLSLDEEDPPDWARLQRIRRVGRRVVAALAEGEERARQAWLAPRPVRRVDLCVTLDRLPASLVSEALANEGQREEWRRLHGVEAPDVLPGLACGFAVDTRHFPRAFVDRLLHALGDLDAAIDGWAFHADNRPALRLLLPAFEGRVRCVVTDPPYNTGLSAFAYRDGFRRSSWLSLLAETVGLTARLLAADGASFVLCDDNEQPRLRLLLDEAFGEENFVATIVWKKVSARKNKALVSVSHDYLIAHARDAKAWRRNLLPRTAEHEKDYQNRDGDPRGPWRSVSFSVKSEHGDRRAPWRYPVETPGGAVHEPPVGRHWNGLPERFEELRRDGRIWFGPDGLRRPRVKLFLSEVQGGIVPDTWWDAAIAGDNQEAKRELLDLVSDLVPGEPFQTPKPTRLFAHVLAIATRPDGREVVLDPFAGAGTAAHAVLDRNRADGGDRRYVLVEKGAHFDDTLVPRLKRVVRASRWKKGRPLTDDPVSHAFAVVRLVPFDEALAARDSGGAARAAALAHPFAGPVDPVWTAVLALGLRVRSWSRREGVLVVAGEDRRGARLRLLWRDVDDVPDDAFRAWLDRHPTPNGWISWANHPSSGTDLRDVATLF